MPLPPAPTKRADRVPAKAFDASARPASRPQRKAESVELAPVKGVVVPLSKPVAKESPKFLPQVSVLESTVAAAKFPIAKPAGNTKRAKRLQTGPAKLFVLDTNVLLHDPMCLFRFEEHDIYLPMIVLEELDGHKKGMTEVARNARQTSRTLDALAGTPGADITAGFQLASTGHRDARGKLLFQTQPLDYALPTSLPQGKADNQILGVV